MDYRQGYIEELLNINKQKHNTLRKAFSITAESRKYQLLAEHEWNCDCYYYKI